MALVEVTDQNYKDTVLNASGLMMLDFGATWCAPCKKLDPIVKELAEEYDGKVAIAKVDVGEHREVATHFGIMNVPVLLFLIDGKPSGSFNSFVPKKKISARLDELLAKQGA